MKLPRRRFENIVERALDRIPDMFRPHLQNLVIRVESRPSPDLLAEMGLAPDDTLFGLYTGIPLPERSVAEPPLYPDEIVIFQEPLEAYCLDAAELEAEIGITVVHEIAHYLGIDEQRLSELGYG